MQLQVFPCGGQCQRAGPIDGRQAAQIQLDIKQRHGADVTSPAEQQVRHGPVELAGQRQAGAPWAHWFLPDTEFICARILVVHARSDSAQKAAT
jgi:hypothetical protein